MLLWDYEYGEGDIMGLDREMYLVVRDQTVTKGNDLIQQSRFNLSLVQQKILLYLIAQINPFDTDFREYSFKIPEFCKTCGIDYDNGNNYRYLKAAIKEIADKSVWVERDNTEILLRWIEKAKIDKRSGTIAIRLDDDMRPYLLQLQERFTSYELVYTLKFKSKYSIRLYELVQSLHYHELEPYTCKYDLDRLRRSMGAERYQTWQHFKDRAFSPAITEINAFSDKTIDYEPIKQGRGIVGVELYISSKNTWERLRIRSDIEKELGTDQLTLWDIMREKGIVIDG